MAPSFCIDLSAGEREQLLLIARQSIRHGLQRDLQQGRPLQIALHELSEALTACLGTFVTLTQQGNLRGCVGSMQSTEPLAQAVNESAYSAAFQDHRFTPLEAAELDQTCIEISLLSPIEPVPARNRSELLSALRPEVDGLLLKDRHHRATFLPKVWEQLPEPELFLDHLLSKAGLPTDHWSTTLCTYRYQTITFSDEEET